MKPIETPATLMDIPDFGHTTSASEELLDHHDQILWDVGQVTVFTQLPARMPSINAGTLNEGEQKLNVSVLQSCCSLGANL